jgi:hypothetical protein
MAGMRWKHGNSPGAMGLYVKPMTALPAGWSYNRKNNELKWDPVYRDTKELTEWFAAWCPTNISRTRFV